MQQLKKGDTFRELTFFDYPPTPSNSRVFLKRYRGYNYSVKLLGIEMGDYYWHGDLGWYLTFKVVEPLGKYKGQKINLP